MKLTKTDKKRLACLLAETVPIIITIDVALDEARKIIFHKLDLINLDEDKRKKTIRNIIVSFGLTVFFVNIKKYRESKVKYIQTNLTSR